MSDWPVRRMVSTSRGTLGARLIDPTDRNNDHCFLCRRVEHPKPIVRFNIDGIWTNLCAECREQAIDALTNPEEAK